MRERTIRLSSGRKLQAREGGDLHGTPVFCLHGTPGSRLIYGPDVTFASSNGIRLIGYDRPGYGGSTPSPGRRVGDAAGDVVAIANDLGLDRFAVYGFSGGGAPSLACAALLPQRVVAAASLAGVAPYPADGLDWIAGAGELNASDFKLMTTDPRAWEAKNQRDRDEAMGATPEQVREYLATLLSDVDRAAFTPEVAEFLVRQEQVGLRPGAEGMRDDNLSEIKPWGFELSSIRVPVQIWHGGQDRFVPPSHGKWIAARIPHAELHFEPKEGHLSIIMRRVPDVLTWLATKF